MNSHSKTIIDLNQKIPIFFPRGSMLKLRQRIICLTRIKKDGTPDYLTVALFPQSRSSKKYTIYYFIQDF